MPTILNTSNALCVEKKATADFLNQQFFIHSTSLLYYLRQNSDVDNYCQTVLDFYPAYQSKAVILSAIVQPERRLPKCVICGNLIPYRLAKGKKKHYFCSKECAMSEEGKCIQVKLYKEVNPISPMRRPEVKEKQKQTLLKKYGVDNVSKLPEIRKKANQTTFERYGVYNMWLHPEVQTKIVAAARKQHYENLVKNMDDIEMKVLFSFQDYIDKAIKLEYVPFQCKHCGEIVHKKINNPSTIYCKSCKTPGTSSKIERNFCDWLSNYINVETGVYDILNNGLEIDIFSREKNIGFEFNGLYWHSERAGKAENYHLNKTKICNDRGVRLIQIFEDEWYFKRNIIQSRIKNILGVTPYKIFARKCEIKKIERSLCEKFLEKYHLQGKDNSSVRLGLFYKNRLVAVMTFGKPRFNKKFSWELIRYATLSNFNIVGGAGKLLNYFKLNYSGSIITYADRRWSEGNLYKKLGFDFKGYTKPNYFYTKNLLRLSRYKCQKHKLKNLLKENFDPNLSEHQNMNNNKFYKIWDCGNMIFTLDN